MCTEVVGAGNADQELSSMGSIAPVPEPGSFLLIASGLAGLVAWHISVYRAKRGFALFAHFGSYGSDHLSGPARAIQPHCGCGAISQSRCLGRSAR